MLLFDSGVYISESEDGLIESLLEGFFYKIILIMLLSCFVMSFYRGWKKFICFSLVLVNFYCYFISVFDNG